jgi:hypothetical protein
LSLELGSDTESWCAEFALRRRVSMSATGSVIVMCCFLCSPGFVRLYKTADLWWLGPVGTEISGSGVLFGAEREADVTQQRTALGIRLRRGDHGDVEAADAVDPVLVDLVEDRLLLQTEGVVSVAVELLRRQAAEVADAGQGERDQTVQELPGAVAAERDVCADGLSLAQLELRDRLARRGDDGLLAVILVRSSTAPSITLLSRAASPTPVFTTTLTIRGIWLTLA